jgi:hypothetical protein
MKKRELPGDATAPKNFSREFKAFKDFEMLPSVISKKKEITGFLPRCQSLFHKFCFRIYEKKTYWCSYAPSFSVACLSSSCDSLDVQKPIGIPRRPPALGSTIKPHPESYLEFILFSPFHLTFWVLCEVSTARK